MKLASRHAWIQITASWTNQYIHISFNAHIQLNSIQEILLLIPFIQVHTCIHTCSTTVYYKIIHVCTCRRCITYRQWYSWTYSVLWIPLSDHTHNSCHLQNTKSVWRITYVIKIQQYWIYSWCTCTVQYVNTNIYRIYMWYKFFHYVCFIFACPP